MTLKKNDFIEIQFTGKVKDGEIFDSNVKEDIKKMSLDIEPKPLVFCLGESMFLKGVDDFLIGKDIGKYEIELTPEKAFGQRDPRFVTLVPMKVFRQQNVHPVAGMSFNFDGRIAKILSVSGGRIIADFNNPIAGKTVTYNVNIVRKVDDINEKAKSIIDFLFRRDFNFEIKEKKIKIKADKNFAKFIELFKEKFKTILDLDLEVEEIEEKTKSVEKS